MVGDNRTTRTLAATTVGCAADAEHELYRHRASLGTVKRHEVVAAELRRERRERVSVMTLGTRYAARKRYLLLLAALLQRRGVTAVVVACERMPVLRVARADGSGPWVLAMSGWDGVERYRWCPVPGVEDTAGDFLASCSEPGRAAETIEAAWTGVATYE